RRPTTVPGGPVDINAPARSLHRQRGHRADLGSSWLPTSRRIGEAELTWGFPTRRRQKAGRVAAAIAMVTAGVEAKSWDPIQGHYEPPEGRTMERGDTLRPEIRLVNAGSRSKAPGVDQTRREDQKGSRQQGRVPAAPSRERCTRGPRAPGVAS